jgi:hypothetical protein
LKSLNVVVSATLVFLVSTIIAGAYYHQPITDVQETHFVGISTMDIPPGTYERPEQAKGLGFKGVLKVDFIEPIPRWIIVSKAHPQNITFIMSFISFEDKTETVVILGSKDHDVGYMYSWVGDYTTFMPNGTLVLRVGEVTKAFMVLSVPPDLDHGMSFPRALLGGTGISTERSVLLITNLMDEPAY